MKRKLQIFVSSTYTDLHEERQAAVAAILKAGHIPAGMELFTAGDKSQLVTIKKWIDECDVYMLILGARYGSIEPISGKSYTEVEFDYAVSKGMPLYSIVASDASIDQKVKISGRAILEAERVVELKTFREKVLTNMSSFFDDVKDIKLCVHESLSEFSGDPRIVGWVPASEIEDTKKIVEQIRTLQIENQNLKTKLAASEATNKKTVDNAEKVSDTIRSLFLVEIDVPKEFSNGKKQLKMSLMELFYLNKETFISGIQNSVGMSEIDSYFYFTIAPRLQIYGIVDNEKVQGVRYRRTFVTKFGNEVLVEFEKRFLRKKEKMAKDAAPAGPTSL